MSYTTRRRQRGLSVVALACAGALVLSACGGDSADDTTPDAGDETTAETTDETSDDSTDDAPDAAPGAEGERNLSLKVGTVLPQTGSLAFLGPPEESGVGLARDEINEAAKGMEVTVEWGDSGDADNRAFDTTIPRMLSAEVSALIGAASSGVTALFLDQVVAAGVLTFSPANTSPAFTDWEDDGLYFRTAPSDALQGEVLGNLVAEDGHSNLGIIWLNDPYGSGLNDALTENFEAAGGTVVASESYNSNDTSFDAQVSTIMAANPDAIAVIAFEESSTIIPAFVSQGFDGSNFYLVDGNMSQWGDDMPVSLEGSKGTTPMGGDIDDAWFEALEQWHQDDRGKGLDGETSYAAESYDAMNLIAIASFYANDTDPRAIADALQTVSGGAGDGEACNDFPTCADIILDGGTPNYEGLSGPIDFDENGDPTGATIGIFQYGADNTHTRLS